MTPEQRELLETLLSKSSSTPEEEKLLQDLLAQISPAEFESILSQSLEIDQTAISLLARELVAEFKSQQTNFIPEKPTTLDEIRIKIAQRRAFYELLIANAKKFQQQQLKNSPTQIKTEVATKYPKDISSLESKSENINQSIESIAAQLSSSNPSLSKFSPETVEQVGSLILAGVVNIDRDEIAIALVDCQEVPTRLPTHLDADVSGDVLSYVYNVPSKKEVDTSLTTPETMAETEALYSQLIPTETVSALPPSLVESAKTIPETQLSSLSQNLPAQSANDNLPKIICENPTPTLTDKEFLGKLDQAVRATRGTDLQANLNAPSVGKSTSIDQALGLAEGIHEQFSTPASAMSVDHLRLASRGHDPRQIVAYAKENPNSPVGKFVKENENLFKNLNWHKNSQLFHTVAENYKKSIADTSIGRKFDASPFAQFLRSQGLATSFILNPVGTLRARANFFIGKQASKFIDPFTGKLKKAALNSATKILGKAGMETLTKAAGSMAKFAGSGAIKRAATEALRTALIATGVLAWLAPFADAIVWVAEKLINLTFGLLKKGLNSISNYLTGEDFDPKAAAAGALAAGMGALAALSAGIMAVIGAASIVFLSPLIFAVIIGAFVFFWIPTINIAPLLSTLVHLESGLGTPAKSQIETISFDPNICGSNIAAAAREVESSLYLRPGYVYYDRSSLYPDFIFLDKFWCTAMIMKSYERAKETFPQNLWGVYRQKDFFVGSGRYVSNGDFDPKKLPLGTAVIWNFYDREGSGIKDNGHVAVMVDNPTDQPFVTIVESNSKLVTRENLTVKNGKLLDNIGVGIQGFGLPPCATINQ